MFNRNVLFEAMSALCNADVMSVSTWRQRHPGRNVPRDSMLTLQRFLTEVINADGGSDGGPDGGSGGGSDGGSGGGSSGGPGDRSGSAFHHCSYTTRIIIQHEDTWEHDGIHGGDEATIEGVHGGDEATIEGVHGGDVATVEGVHGGDEATIEGVHGSDATIARDTEGDETTFPGEYKAYKPIIVGDQGADEAAIDGNQGADFGEEQGGDKAAILGEQGGDEEAAIDDDFETDFPGGSMLKKELIVGDNFFDPKYDWDFTNVRDSKTYLRGQVVYERPCGWYRYALKVLNEYGDNNWLGHQNRSTSSVDGEWPVCYFVETVNKVQDLAQRKYQAPNKAGGRNVICTPFISEVNRTAKRFYSQATGTTYCVVLQNRVRDIVHNRRNDRQWKVSADNQGAIEDNVRPYGLLVKRV